MSPARPATLRQALLGLLMVLPALASLSPAAAFPITEEQQATIDQFGLLPGAPFGEWEPIKSLDTFYFHSEVITDTTGGEVGGATQNVAGIPEIPLDVPLPIRPHAYTTDLRRPRDSSFVVNDDVPPQAGTLNERVIFLNGDSTAANPDVEGQGAIFVMPDQLRALDDIHLYGFQGSVYAAGLGVGGTIRVRVFDSDGVSASLVADFDMVADLDPRVKPPNPIDAGGLNDDTTLQAALPYSGSTTTVQENGVERNGANEPYTLERGHSLLVYVSVRQDAGVVVLYLDTLNHPSLWRVHSDSVRINMWTENRVRQVTDIFPPVLEANSADRRVRIKAMHFNAWGNAEGLSVPQGSQPAECDPPPAANVDPPADICPRDNLPQENHRLRIQDITPDHDTFRQYVPMDQGIGRDPLPSVGCCSDIGRPEIDRPIEYVRLADLNVGNPADRGLGLLEYTFTYGEQHQDLTPFQSGRYRIELYDAQRSWFTTKDITIGELGFDFGLAAGETAAHTVAVGQATDYILAIKNKGGATDQFGVSVASPGDGWTASAVPSLLTLAPGAEGRVTVTITPATAGALSSAGTVKAVRVDAVSLFNNLVKSQVVTTTLTGEIRHAVDLTSLTPLIEGRPGSTQAIPIGIRNTGTVADTYLVTAEADDAALAAGWTFSLTPNYLPLRAASRQDLVLQVFAPPEAVPGTSFTLRIHAVLDTSTDVRDTLDLTVGVLIQDKLVTSVLDGNLRQWRDFGFCNGNDPDCQALSGDADADFDDAAVYRFRVENQGDREDTYTLSASWNAPRADNPSTDNSSCDGAPSSRGDGVPDGLRFFLLSGVGPDTRTGPHEVVSTMGVPTGAQTQETLMGTVTIPAHQVADAYVQVSWLRPSGNGCDTAGGLLSLEVPSQFGELRVTTRSANDPNIRSIQNLGVELTHRGLMVDSRGESPAQRHAVSVEPALGLATGVVEAVDKVVLPGGFTDYRVRAINLGNEHDTLTIGVGTGQRGWNHRIVLDSWDIVNSTLSSTASNSNPPDRDCVATASGTVSCTRIGVYDEVHFTVRATPPLDARIGDVDTLVVSVASAEARSEGIIDTLHLETTVTGTFLFALEALNANLKVEPEQTVAFPFTIRNVGTNADTYQLSVEQGSTSWLPALSSAPQVGVPAGRNFHGFLIVNAPQAATVGQVEHFRIKVQSLGPAGTTSQPQAALLDFFANVTERTGLIVSVPPRTVLAGSQPTFQVVAEDTRQAASAIQFDIDPQTLPRGWTLVCGGDPTCQPARPQTDLRVLQEVDLDQDGESDGVFAVGDYTVVVPAGELGASRAILRVCALTDDERRACHDAVFNLQSTYGVSLPEGPLEGVIAPGVPFTHKVRVENTGLTAETVGFTLSAAPQGWTVAPLAGIALQPGEAKEVNVMVTSSPDARPGEQAVLLLTATVQGQTLTDTMTLITRVGSFELALESLVAGDDPVRAYVAPLEEAAFLLNVTNMGELSDEAVVDVTLPAAYAQILDVEWGEGCDELTAANECRIRLERSLDPTLPDPAREVAVSIRIPADLVPGVRIPVTFQAESVLANPPVSDIVANEIEVLAYAAQDVDQDGAQCGEDYCAVNEYAVDRNRDPADGFEEFIDPQEGLKTRPADLARFLSDEARARKTVLVRQDDGTDASVLNYLVDGDQDGRTDHFLDTTLDGLPDLYWDPDLRAVFGLTQTKDVNNDGVRDYFIDLDGDGRLDVWFDIIEGEFGPLVQLFVNADSIVDYVVDLDKDGIADPGEPVLIGSELGLGAIASIIQQVDMNGDGKLDTVVDEDGDGTPDFFIPNGETASIPITLKDVTGDGVADWTYPSKGEGRPDSYYDPVEGKSGFIDTRSQFVQELEKYWYIGALFLVVLALFVVLVAVTRR